MADLPLYYCSKCANGYGSIVEAQMCRIGCLLQQLVDKGEQRATLTNNRPRYSCGPCQIGWDTYEHANRHWESGEHERMQTARKPG